MKLPGPLCHPGPLSHPGHPQHKLKPKHTKNLFMCNGCKEAGIGYKYKCDECNFNLHEKCALPTPTIIHDFYQKCEFRFHNRLPRKMKCEACNEVVQGFGFQSRDHVLHPCCAYLQSVLRVVDVDLHLCPMNLLEPCYKCEKKGHGWSYTSNCGKHNLHVACAKKLLMKTWDDMHQNKDEKNETEIQAIIRTRVVTPSNERHGKDGGGRPGNILKYAGFFADAAHAVVSAVSALLGDPTAIMAVSKYISRVAKYILPSPSMKRLGN